jgi:Uncharacterized protein conserved in bacteria
MTIFRRPHKLAILISLALLCGDAFAATTKEMYADKFAQLSDQYMKDTLARYPSNASQFGYHKHTDPKTGKILELDAMLDDVSLEFISSEREFYSNWRKRFREETPPSQLDAQDRADWQLIDDQIGVALLDAEQIKTHKHNPTWIVEMIGSAVFQPLTVDYAPKAVRVGHAVSRIAEVPRALKQVKEYIDDCSPVFVSAAIAENAGNIELIEKTIAEEIPKNDSELKAKYEEVSPPAVAALKDFTRWLQDDLAKRKTDRSWRLGKALYDKKFKLVIESDITPEQLLAEAEKELKAVRAEMLQIALPLHKQMYPTHDQHKKLKGVARENLIIKEVLTKIGAEHPKRDQLQQAVEADLEGIKKFIREKNIVSLSARDNLKVVPTPPFLRTAYSVAAFHSAPPLEPQSQAEYWVTPIDPATSDAKAESLLQEYNNYTLKWLTIHEALPGHYIQFEHLNNIEPARRRLLRSLYGNGAYVEGWAEYIAQVMMDEGYSNNDPRFRLIMRKIRLRVLANSILDIRMHTMNMTDKEALKLMMTDAFQTQSEAEGKLLRAKLTSTQLPTYYAGIREWFQLRKAYQAKAGAKFNLQKFHDLVLSFGPIPVSQVQKIVLDELETSK